MTKIQRTRRSATPRSSRRPARALLLTPAFFLAARGQRPAAVGTSRTLVVGGGGQLVVVDLAGILAVGRGHDRDLLAPHVELEPWEAPHLDAHSGRHHLVGLAVPPLAPLRFRAVVHEVLELDALEPVEEVDAGGERRVAVDGVAPQ